MLIDTVAEVLADVGDGLLSSPDAPGDPTGTGPWDAAGPAAGAGAEADDPEAEKGDDYDPYEKGSTDLEDLLRTGREAIDDMWDLATEHHDIASKPTDELTEDERLARGEAPPLDRDQSTSEKIAEKALEKALDEALDHDAAPPVLDYAVDQVGKLFETGRRAYEAVSTAKAREERIHKVIKDANTDGESDE